MQNAEATPPTQELPVSASEPRPKAAPTRLRFNALAAAVRAHQVVTSHGSVPMRPSDHALYRRLAEIETSPPIPGEDSGRHDAATR